MPFQPNHYHTFGQQRRIILASQSPRRQQLLTEAGLLYEVITHDTDESYPPHLPVAQIAEHIALQKALAVKNALKSASDVIIGADTIVEINGQILGKPANETQAHHFLHLLSGKQHRVVTGICLLSLNRCHTFHVSTIVHFCHLTNQQIEYYVQTCKPYDKAGGYAIQEWIGLTGIEKIDGCYFNVMGLPVSRLLLEMSNF
ncbi:septum formation protein Maf [Sphingobacteriales bacterium UPWRP_1]|nr:septum formation protein Maf [Sphingobacteriales bacterium TSM_CSM]PSJ75847.1 septum formation protein Maf [Sphingobacteriales bacterium UPWRP_1]